MDTVGRDERKKPPASLLETTLVAWSAARLVALPGIDIHDTASWRKFVDTDDAWVRRYPVAAGAMADPDLVELKSGILACGRLSWYTRDLPRSEAQAHRS